MFKSKGLIFLIISLVFVTFVFSGCKVETVKEHNAKTTASVSNVDENSPVLEDGTSVNGGTLSATSTTTKNAETPNANKTTGNSENGNVTVQPQSPQTPQGNENANIQSSTTKSPTVGSTTSNGTVQSVQVTVSVICKNAVGNKSLKDGIVLPKDGVILNSLSVVISDNNAFEATKEACEKSGTAFLYSNSMFGKYVSKIGPIAEKECGADSGWTFTVNGEYPQKTCESVELKNGDKIQWIYKAK